MLGAEASGADIDPLGLPLDEDGGLFDIGQPAPVGAPTGVADIVTKLARLPAEVTLPGQFPSFNTRVY